MGCSASQTVVNEKDNHDHESSRSLHIQGLEKLRLAGLLASQRSDKLAEAQAMANQAIQIFRELNCSKEEVEAMLILAAVYQNEPLKQKEVLELAEQTCQDGLGESHTLMDKIHRLQSQRNS